MSDLTVLLQDRVFMERTLTNGERAKIVALWKMGKTSSEIAEETMRSSETVRRVLSSYDMGPGLEREVRHDLVRKLREQGLGPSAIAQETGYTRQQVHNILKKETG